MMRPGTVKEGNSRWICNEITGHEFFILLYNAMLIIYLVLAAVVSPAPTGN